MDLNSKIRKTARIERKRNLKEITEATIKFRKKNKET